MVKLSAVALAFGLMTAPAWACPWHGEGEQMHYGVAGAPRFSPFAALRGNHLEPTLQPAEGDPERAASAAATTTEPRTQAEPQERAAPTPAKTEADPPREDR